MAQVQPVHRQPARLPLFRTSASATKQASSLRPTHPEPIPRVSQRQDEEPNTPQQENKHPSEEDPSLTRNTSSRGSTTVPVLLHMNSCRQYGQ
jgi:hypothetical protein